MPHPDATDVTPAIGAPDWAAARAACELEIAAGGGAEVHERLAAALLWQHELDAALRAMEKAYVLFRRGGQYDRAAWAALWIGGQYLRQTGNGVVAGGWFARCERLLARAEPSAELGRVVLMRALSTNDPVAIERGAAQAMEIARQFGDADYELLAMAYGGLAMVVQGRIQAGLAQIDEAMAATVAGEVRAPEAVGQIYCALLSGCERTVDFERAEQWHRVAQPFLGAYGQAGVSGSCRATYAAVLAATGDWSGAERELLVALRTFDSGSQGMRADALVRLADLRIRQGRLDEGARLLEGVESHPDAQLPMAELEMARGHPAIAVGLLQRRLRQLGHPNLQAAPLLLRLTEAHLAAGDHSGADDAAASLVELAALAGGGCLLGLSGLALGLSAAATGQDPLAHFEAAVEHLELARLSWEAARARLGMAEALAASNPEMAIREARLAMTAFRALGAGPAADRVGSLLRSLGVRTGAGPAVAGELSRREQQVARLVGIGLSNSQIAERLFLSPRTVEHHVTSILRKLPTEGRAGIAAYAVRHLDIADSG